MNQTAVKLNGTSMPHPPTRPQASVPSLMTDGNLERKHIQLPDDLRWVESALGSRLVRGGIYLWAGSPGSGKSSGAMQIALGAARCGQRSILITTEQDEEDLKHKARLQVRGFSPQDMAAVGPRIHPFDQRTIQGNDDLYPFLVNRVLRKGSPYADVSLIIVDSVQGHGTSPNSTKAYGALFAFFHQCKAAGITVIAICHVTKQGTLAGPRSLEHEVDVVMRLGTTATCRPFTVPKNRYGPAVLKPIALEFDANTNLQPSHHAHRSAAAVRTFLGPKAGFGEVQIAVSLPDDGGRGRILSQGISQKEIQQIASVVNSIPGLQADLNFELNCRMPMDKKYRPLSSLPLAIALVAGYLRRDVPEDMIFCGELDLLRRVRGLDASELKDLSKALANAPIPLPCRVVMPEDLAQHVGTQQHDLDIIGVSTLEEAIIAAWPDLQDMVQPAAAQ